MTPKDFEDRAKEIVDSNTTVKHFYGKINEKMQPILTFIPMHWLHVLMVASYDQGFVDATWKRETRHG